MPECVLQIPVREKETGVHGDPDYYWSRDYSTGWLPPVGAELAIVDRSPTRQEHPLGFLRFVVKTVMWRLDGAPILTLTSLDLCALSDEVGIEAGRMLERSGWVMGSGAI